MTPEAVVFDIGRVLIGWDPEGFYDRHIGEETRRQLFAEVDLHGMNLAIDAGASWRDTVLATCDANPIWEAQIECWLTRWTEMIGPPIDHSVRLLRALRRRGVPVIALTNFGRETFALARTRYDFFNEFDGAIVSGEARVIKPDPAIYDLVERLTGLTGPNLIFADDSAPNIAAAAARGWKTHHFTAPQGWADRLVAEGLLSAEEAA